MKMKEATERLVRGVIGALVMGLLLVGLAYPGMAATEGAPGALQLTALRAVPEAANRYLEVTNISSDGRYVVYSYDRPRSVFRDQFAFIDGSRTLRRLDLLTGEDLIIGYGYGGGWLSPDGQVYLYDAVFRRSLGDGWTWGHIVWDAEGGAGIEYDEAFQQFASCRHWTGWGGCTTGPEYPRGTYVFRGECPPGAPPANVGICSVRRTDGTTFTATWPVSQGNFDCSCYPVIGIAGQLMSDWTTEQGGNEPWFAAHDGKRFVGQFDSSTKTWTRLTEYPGDGPDLGWSFGLGGLPGLSLPLPTVIGFSRSHRYAVVKVYTPGSMTQPLFWVDFETGRVEQVPGAFTLSWEYGGDFTRTPPTLAVLADDGQSFYFHQFSTPNSPGPLEGGASDSADYYRADVTQEGIVLSAATGVVTAVDAYTGARLNGSMVMSADGRVAVFATGTREPACAFWPYNCRRPLETADAAPIDKPGKAKGLVVRTQAPDGLPVPSADGADRSITVTWDPAGWPGDAAITGYRLEVSTNGARWRRVATAKPAVTALRVRSLRNGNSYRFRVAAIRGKTLGQWRESLPALPYSAPAAPTRLRTSTTPGGFVLSWRAPSTNGARIVDYVIETSLDGRNWTRVDDGVSASTSVTVDGLLPARRYFVRVAAVNGAGQGGYARIRAVATT